ncbi:uncharacterized protein LOC141687304 [Apium graveolens]|uniref:uncharacterized protein LOC141687304 n=1 Tax=Apium graveolens TaxID=4045 RepID=UPI003D7BB91F
MSTVKGILKGLRYISQIFEKEEEEEEEIQIGNPTDVKHVAHIGNDGPANSKPSWMKEASSETKSNVNQKKESKSSSREIQNSSDGGSESSTKSDKKKQSKRHAAKAYIGSIGTSAREATSSGKPRRQKNPNAESQQSSIGLDSPARDPNTPKKSSRPKKSKAGSSKSKAQNSLNDNFSSSPGPGYERDNGKISQRSVS